MKILQAFLALLLACAAFAAPAPAFAERLTSEFCTLHMPIDSSFEDALAARGGCSPGNRSLAGPRIWSFAPIAERVAPGERLQLSGEFAEFDALHVYTRNARGRWRGRSYDSTIAADGWRAGMRYTVDIPADAREIAIAVDRPWHLTAATEFRVVPAERADTNHYVMSVIYALFLGLMIVPLVYNTLFYAVMREQFMLWHITMIVGILGYTLFASGFIYYLVPGISLAIRWQMHIISIAGGVCGMTMFCRTFMEPEAIASLIRRALGACSALIIAATLFAVLGGDGVRTVADTIYLLSFLPALILFFVAIGQGLWRGSRAARFQAVAWTPLLLCGADRIARGVGLYDGPIEYSHAVYGALAFETIVTAIGITDRILMIRRQRDKAQEREKVLAALAETDELTGLPDRRGIMAAFDDEGDARAFAIIDLDHFKKVNDRHGHDTGDRVLRSVGSLLAAWSDITAGRLGGEEFVAFLHGADPESAAERLQRAITIRIARDVPELEETVTASMGVVRIKPGQDFISAYRASDKCLYRAKEAGRNRVVFGPDLRARPRDNRAAA